MKKVMKIAGIVVLILVIGVFLLIKYLGSMPAASKGYQKTVETGGDIEKKYMASGEFKVSSYEESALQGFGKYLIYYPSNLNESNHTYPVIVLSNGTGVPMSKYTAVAEHFASWGFLVIGTEEEYDWNGFSAEMCIRYLELLDENKIVNEKDNIFYQKINFESVGIVGHSQGGVGVINAITTQSHSDVFKVAVVISPTNKELAANLQWDYDVAKIKVPTMLISGAGGGDDWVVTGEQLEEIYDDISSDKVMLRRKDTSHSEMLYSADGYVLAWFMWQLQGDSYAARAFTGDNAEIAKNELYQDYHINFNE